MVKVQNAYFSTLSSLFTSFISPVERIGKYAEPTTSSIDPKLVTASVFSDMIFPNLSNNKVAYLTSERAWFGIRSILKGGFLALHNELKFSESDFNQLTGETSEDKIPRSATIEYFNNDELRNLIVLYRDYQNYLDKKKIYDEIDLVYRALRHHEGVTAKNNSLRDKSFEKFAKTAQEQGNLLLSFIKMNNGKILFKPLFYKNLDNDANFTSNILQWLKKLDRGDVSTARRAGVQRGVIIYKNYLKNGSRIFFSKLKTTEEVTPHSHRYVVYGICKKHDEQENFLRKIIRKENMIHSEIDEKIITSKVKSKDDTPGDGPLKPWPRGGAMKLEDLAKISLPSNLDLDDNQKKTLLRQQPLLIDGLAGTGKTSVLAYRSAMRTALSSEGTNILVCASKNHVVKRMLENHIEYTENGAWDDKDPFEVKYFISPDINTEKDEKITQTDDLEHFNSTLPETGLDEIIIDECQDLTYLEFQMLVRLCIRHDVRRITIAGDPLQTLNPTGFDWSRIKAMFVRLSELKPKDIQIQSFHKNYRSQGSIVEFANAIQRHRSHITNNSDIIRMIPAKESGDRAALILYNPKDPSHVEATHKILMNSERSATSVVVWAKDDAEVLQMLKGESDEVDSILTSLWKNKAEDEDSLSFREQKILIHSSSSIKGGEVEAVALYRFGSSPDAKKYLKSLNQDVNEIKSASTEELIPIKYAYSRLYVGLTRAFQKVFLIEDKEGLKFWDSLKLTRLGADNEQFTAQPDFFINFNDYEDVVAASNAVELTSSMETTLENFYSKMEDFLKTRDRISLDIAIALGDELVEQGQEIKRDLANLKAERALIRKDNTEDDKLKKKLLQNALDYFTEAGKLDRVIPIFFGMGRYSECIDRLRGFADNDFLNFVKFSCELHLRKSENEKLDASKNISIKDLLIRRITVPDIWRSLIDVVKVKEAFKKYLQKILPIKDIVNLVYEYGGFVYSLDELLNKSNYTRQDKLFILTNRKSDGKYASEMSLYKSLFETMVIQEFENADSTILKRRILENYAVKKFCKEYIEVFRKQFVQYNELLLKDIGKIQKPKTGKKLFEVLSDYKNDNYNPTKQIFDIDLNDKQLSALILALHIKEINEGVHSGYVPKAISQVVDSLEQENKEWETYKINELFKQSDSLYKLLSGGMKNLRKIKDIEALGITCFSWYNVETHVRILSGIWDSMLSSSKETDFNYIFSNGYVPSGVESKFEKKFASVYTTAYKFVSQLDEKRNLQNLTSDALFNEMRRLMDGEVENPIKIKFFKSFVEYVIVDEKLPIYPGFLDFFKQYVISMNYDEKDLKGMAIVRNNEIQKIVNSLKRMASKKDLIKNNTQSEKRKKSLQNLIKELMELDVNGIIGLQDKIDSIKSKLPMTEIELFELLDSCKTFSEYTNKLITYSESHTKLIEQLLSKNALNITSLGDEFSLNKSSILKSDLLYLTQDVNGNLKDSQLHSLLSDLIFKEKQENYRLGLTGMLFLPNIGTLWYLNVNGRIDLDSEVVDTISFGLTTQIIRCLDMAKAMDYDNEKGKKRILQIIKNQQFDGSDVDLEKAIIEVAYVPKEFIVED